jgi:hypothetical protein
LAKAAPGSKPRGPRGVEVGCSIGLWETYILGKRPYHIFLNNGEEETYSII